VIAFTLIPVIILTTPLIYVNHSWCHVGYINKVKL